MKKDEVIREVNEKLEKIPFIDFKIHGSREKLDHLRPVFKEYVEGEVVGFLGGAPVRKD